METRQDLIDLIAETMHDTCDMDVSFHQYATAVVDKLLAAGLVIENESSNALNDIAAERERQVNAEGWTAEHDDQHEDQSLAQAAASYCLMAAEMPQTASDVWPYTWDEKWLKSTEPRRDLVKAGALIVAEIDRLDRITANEIPA